MNFLRTLLPSKSAAPALPRERLPEVHAFVEVAVGNSRQRESVPIDAIDDETLCIRSFAGLRVGDQADFLYANAAGRFRFSTVCVAADARQAHFKLPTDIKTLASYNGKRSAVRLESTLPVHWRYAPGGQGNGDFVKGSLSDLSCGGASLVIGRDLKKGTYVEIRFSLKSSPTPLVVMSEVMRTGKIQSSGKSSAGVRFLDVDSAGEKAINEFIHERQTVRRERGMV